jgi:ribosomal-protein-alanine N-acetyltransferase
MIRPRVAADIAQCLTALRATHEADGYPMVWPADPVGWLDDPRLIAAWVAVAEQDDRILGHLALVQPAPGALTEVSRLFVDPGARGQGLATHLLEVAGAYAEPRRLTLVLEGVAQSVDAIALYEKLGWRLQDSRAADWLGPDGVAPIMRRYLSPNSK